MTISNDDELGQALDALSNLRLALAALRRDVVNARNFGVMAEGPLDEISRIEAEVDEYLGVHDSRAQLWMRVSGKNIEAGDAPTAVLTSLLDSFRKGLQAATEHAYTGKLSARPTANVQRAVEVRFAAVSAGSVRIGLNIDHDPQLDLSQLAGLEAAASRSLKEYLDVAGWAGSETGSDEDLATVIPDPSRRRLLLNLVMQLAPRARGAIDTLELSGRVVPGGKPAKLTRSSRERLAAAVDRVEQTVPEDHVGPLRELDLDKRTGVVRRDEVAEVPCEFAEELMTTAQEALGRVVRVVGSRTEVSGRKRSTLFVTRLEILDDALDDADATR